MIILDYSVALLLLLTCILVLYLSLQIVLGLLFFSSKKVRVLPNLSRPTVTVLIPAHNEELVLAKTLKSILNQTNENDSVVVVIDNCTDGTEDVCSNFDAKMLIREDTQNRSKGFALDFGLKKIKDAPTDCIIIIDADCILENDALEILAKSAVYHDRPIQALYLIKNLPGQSCSITQKIAEFAFLIKNKIRPAGMRVLGLPCHLTGTGMAFPWQSLIQANLANDNLVEDMKLGIDFVLAGKGPYYEPLAIVSSHFPTDEKAIESQRTRWEHGHISTMLRFIPALVLSSLRKLSFVPLLFCLDLAIPPLALLVITFICSSAVSIAYLLLTNNGLYIILLGAVGFALTLSIIFIWRQHGRGIITFREFWSIPKYIFNKLGIYRKLFGRKETRWIKTKR
jgi:cellulose synthase/poly-beta-1,6-N-acetylglucosamine synthase-like glycosyltransferase